MKKSSTMKNFIKGIFFTMIIFTGGVMTSSCDHCAGIVCTSGTCSNGTCVCDAGYKKSGNECIPISSDYAGEDWHGTEVFSHKITHFTDTQSVSYVIEPSGINPNQIVLKGFLGFSQNDLPFSIDLEKRNIFIEEQVLPVDITNGTLTSPSFLPVLYNASGTINTSEMNITLITIDSLERYNIILRR